jgi:hypothetical protein
MPETSYDPYLIRQRRVARATAALPQTATGSILVVRGGRVAIMLFGFFTVAADGTVTTLAVANTTTGAAADRGATTTLGAATAITSQAIGSIVALGNTVGAALALAAGALIMPTLEHVVNIGTIDLTTSASNAAARVRWVCLWRPIDVGARVERV